MSNVYCRNFPLARLACCPSTCSFHVLPVNSLTVLLVAGPIKTPVAACATAATSVEIGVESIRSGKARVMIAGGYEDFGEEGLFSCFVLLGNLVFVPIRHAFASSSF